MKTQLHLKMLAQPTVEACGPTCLHAVYDFFGDSLSLEEVIAGTPRLHNGGTLAVNLACHALERGYRAVLYTFNLQLFDPSWFEHSPRQIREKLAEQASFKQGRRFQAATEAFIRYLDLGGELRLSDLTASLIRRYLNRDIPILTGLSATYLYQCAREREHDNEYDDIRGHAVGHFVVLCGYNRGERTVQVADPYQPNPMSNSHYYEINIDRLVCSILLGVLTYDANLLILQPHGKGKGGAHS